MSQLIIGLTGGIGSGKTTVANMFAEFGIDIVDADVVARDVVAPGTPALAKIAEYFGADYILANGELNRAKLRERVFKVAKDKDWLNALLHPVIRQTMLTQCKQATSPYCLLVVPLLLENGLDQHVDKVLVVDVTVETQISRTIARDNNDKAQVERIIDAQISREQRVAAADFVIDNNNCSLAELKQQVAQVHKQLLALAG
ncbi:dephospho-CoA kinase [Thalassotalea ponticola]|uniref:dephospho-CoA kinase n=1 Tax=Thalassotalea ponticola TaxID=1523392 RepID=UPI0025B45DB0|nr:dephospho-CoA kinase [Thalassotalea ponticola]MDN3653578.1 dephospho-CoA kinase [Thalassotalea ponticola]